MQEETLKFTMEIEANNSLFSVELKIYNWNSRIKFGIFRKPIQVIIVSFSETATLHLLWIPIFDFPLICY